MPIRSRTNLIMGQIEPEYSELFALELGKIAESDFVYTLSSTNINQSAPNFVYTLSSTSIDQSAPNLVRMHATIRSRISSIMDLIGPELLELSALFDFVYTVASANINQSVPILATIYMPIRSRK